jgi:hypothetical protein
VRQNRNPVMLLALKVSQSNVVSVMLWAYHSVSDCSG